MALNASGPISLGGSTAGESIILENGQPATAVVSLNDAAVRGLAGVLSGAIVMPTDFYGKANAQSISIASNQTNLNLRTYALANGWNGSAQLTVTLNAGVYISSTATGTPGLTIDGSWPGGIKLINNGFIMGMGGDGGLASSSVRSGNPGGPAISLGVSCEIDSSVGYIGGGGGGGAATGSSVNTPPYGTRNAGGGGGAGGGAGGVARSTAQLSSPTFTAPGGTGGAVGGTGGNGQGLDVAGFQGRRAVAGAGGGGGRIIPGTGGAGNVHTGGLTVSGGNGGGSGGGGGLAGQGNPGTLTAGAGGSAGSAGGTGSGNDGQAAGGGGGGWGALGGNSANYGPFAIPPAPGGSGGKAVALNGFVVTWTGGLPATVYGAVS